VLNSNGPCRTFQKFSGFGQCWGSACFWASRIRIHQSEVPIWIRIRLRIFPFSHKKTEDNVPVGRLLEKNMKKNFFFWHPQKSLKKGVGSGAGSGSEASISQTNDPGIRIPNSWFQVWYGTVPVRYCHFLVRYSQLHLFYVDRYLR
jgi:hypothetical protein